MATYKSKPQAIDAGAEAVFDKLSNLSGLKSILAQVPESAVPTDKKEMLDAVRVEEDSITFPAGPVGELTMNVTRRERPVLIELAGANSPVPMSLKLEIAPVSATRCEAAVTIDINIPPMLKPMIGGTLQKMADQFGDMLGKLRYE